MDVRGKLFTLFQDCNNPSWKWFPNNAEMFKLIDYLIAHGVTVQEWISVKDRLPDKRGEYLCYYKFEPDSPDVVCENTYQGSGLWLSEMDKVTHWQPMPQPPKGE